MFAVENGLNCCRSSPMSCSLLSAGSGVADLSFSSVLSRLPIHRLAPGLLGCVLCVPVEALEYQLHRYPPPGFALSNGNNGFCDSTDGSLRYYQVRLNSQIHVR